MKSIVAIVILLSSVLSIKIVLGELYRWDKEPGQVISCIFCMLLMTAFFSVSAYLITRPRNFRNPRHPRKA